MANEKKRSEGFTAAQRLINEMVSNRTVSIGSGKTAGTTSQSKATTYTTPEEYVTVRLNQLGLSRGRVDENFINTFISDATSYLNSSRDRYARMGYSNRESVYEEQKKKADELRSKSWDIRQYLNKNKDSMKAEDYSFFMTFLDEFDKESMSNDYSFYRKKEGMSYETKDAYDQAVRYYGYQQKYQGKTYDELNEVLNTLERDSEEYQWLKDYVPTVMTKEDVDQELVDAEKQLGTLHEYRVAADWYAGYSQNPGAYAGDLYEEDVRRNLAVYEKFTEEFGENNYPNFEELIEAEQRKIGDLRNRKAYNYLEDETDYAQLSSVMTDKMAERHGKLQFMDDKEVGKYNYLYHKYGEESADQYLKDLDMSLNARRTETQLQSIEKHAALDYVLGGSVATSLASGIGYLSAAGHEAKQELGQYFTGEYATPLDTNTLAYMPSRITSTVRGSNAQAIADATGRIQFDEGKNPGLARWFNGKSLGDVYQLGMSMADSLAAGSISKYGPVSDVGGILLAGGAATSTLIEAVDRGATDEEALEVGLIAGGIEFVSEKISLDNLFSGDLSKNIVKAFLKQGGIEASEEAVTSIVNTIADAAIMADKSDVMRQAEAYMKKDPSMTKEEALRKAWADAAISCVWDAVGGFASGGIMGGGKALIGSAKDYHNTQKQHTADGRDIIKADGTSALMDLAKEVAGASNANVKKNITRQVNKVSRKMDTNSTSKATANNVGRLYDSVKTVYSTQNYADIAKALESSGFSAKEANQIAGALIAEANGLELTSKQSALLDQTRSVVDKILNKDMTNITQREQKLGGFEADVTKGLFSKIVNEQTKAGTVNEYLPTETKSLPESHYEVSEEGKTLDSNGNDIVIKGVKSVENGKMILETEAGTIDASEVAYSSQEEALVYSFVSEMGVSADTAWSLIRNFRKMDGVSAEVYARDIPLAYMYGKLNYKAGLNKLSDTLTVNQRMTAFYRGRADADAEVKAKAATKPTFTKSTTVSEKSAEKEIIFDGFTYDEKTARPLQKASIAAIDVINKVSNLEVHVYQSVKKDGKYYANVNGKLRLAPNGYFTDGNKIYIDINAGNHGQGAMLFTMAHEVGHYIAELNAEDFKAISDFLFEHYGEDIPICDLLEAQKEKRIKSYETDGKTVPSDTVLEKEAQEELVCDMLSRMFADQKAYDVLMELKQQDFNLFQKLGQAIKKLLDKLKNLLGVYDNQTQDFRYAASVENFGEKVFRQLQEMYMRAFVKADVNFQTAEKNTTEDGGVKMQTRTINGEQIVWIENSGFTNKQLHNYSAIAEFIAEHIGEYYTIIESGQNVYIGEDLPSEYTHSKYTSFLQKKKPALLKVKNRASTALGEMIEIATNRRWEPAEHKDTKDAKYGMYRYDTKFAFPIKDQNGAVTNIKAYDAELLIRNASDGKKYLYDIVSIKEDTTNALDLRHKEARKGSYKAATQGDVVRVNVAQGTENVKNESVEANKDKTQSVKHSDRDYSYEALTSKPDMVVTTVASNIPKNRADVVAIAKKNAANVGKFDPKTGSVSVHVEDIDADVIIGRDGLKHSLDRRFNVNAPVVLKVGEILGNSIQINELTPQKAEASGSYVLIGTAKNSSGELYVVRSVINRFSNELASMDVLYAINAKKEPAALLPLSTDQSALGTDSTISIAELLDDVNNYFPDILPEEVLKHYGHDARPEGELGQSALYQERDVDSVSNRSLLVKAFENVAQSEIEKQKIQEYKENISFIDAEEQKLHELNEEIKKLSFAKGPRDTKAIQKLQLEAKQTANRISIYDKQLLRLEGSKPLQDVLSRERAKAFKRGKEKGRESLERYRDRRSRSVVAAKIKAFKQRLEQSLLRPTDGQYIPINLVNAMVDVCNIINTDTSLYKADGSLNKAQMQRDLTKEKLQNLKDEYEKLKTHSDPIYAGEFDEMVYAYFTNLRDNFRGKSLKDMSLDELQEMYETLVAIEETLRDARRLIGWGDADSIYEAGDAIVAEQNRITRDRRNGKRNAFGKANDAALNLSLSPVRNVERMSGYNQDSYLLKLFKKFEQGVRKKNMFTMEAYKLFEHLTSGKVYEDAIYKEVSGKKYTDIKGRKFAVSKMQMMQAILSYEREQSNKNLHHIEQDGFTFADLDLLKKGNVAQAISAEHSHRTPASVGLVAEFIDVLKNDKWCQDYMEASRKFFNEKAKDAINEATIATKHRIIAREKNYIPFEVDRNFVAREISAENNIQQTINSYGMLKDTQNNAPQPLIITGLNNVIDRHIDMVGNVYGLAVEVRNFNKVWNVRSFNANGNNPTVKEVIETNWGKGGVKHIEQAVQDIQGPRMREKNAFATLHEKAKSGYIGATFLLNLSVVTKQIGSLYSATSMLRWRDPARQLGNLIYTMANHKKIAAEVDKYSATAWMRRQGLSDAELHALMSEGKKTWLGRVIAKAPAIVNPTKWITAMDHAVALSLWRFAKIDTAKKTGLKGEELLKATAAFYDDVVENTQSMTDVLHRPEIQKSKNVFAESFAMFKTDLYQMAGQLHMATGRFIVNKSKENGKALGRTLYSIAMSAVWGQLMTTVFALLRYKVDPYRDDEDKNLTAESWLKRQGISFVGDILGYIFPIFGSEIAGSFEDVVYGESDGVVGSLAIDVLNDLYNTMITVGAAIKDGEMPEPAAMKKLVAKVLQVFGVPANNILRTWETIRLHAKDIANGEFLSFEAGADRSPKHHIHRIIETVSEGKNSVAIGLYEAALEEIATKNADGGEFGEDETNEAKSSLKTALGDKYKSGEVTKETVKKVLSNVFGMSDDDIYWTFDKWDYAQENGTSDDYGKYEEFYVAVETGKNLQMVTKKYTDNGVSESTLRSEISKNFKPQYMEMSASERAKIRGYLLDAMTELSADQRSAENKIGEWEFEADHPELKDRVTYTQYQKWEAAGKPNGVSIDMFIDVAEYRDPGTSDSVRDQDEVAQFISSMTTDRRMRHALWCCFYKASTSPWR